MEMAPFELFRKFACQPQSTWKREYPSGMRPLDLRALRLARALASVGAQPYALYEFQPCHEDEQNDQSQIPNGPNAACRQSHHLRQSTNAIVALREGSCRPY